MILGTKGSPDRYTRIVGKLNYIGSKLMKLGYKNKDHIGLTLTNPDLNQICQVLKISEEEFRERYRGQTVVWHDLDGNPQIRIDLLLWKSE